MFQKDKKQENVNTNIIQGSQIKHSTSTINRIKNSDMQEFICTYLIKIFPV